MQVEKQQSHRLAFPVFVVEVMKGNTDSPAQAMQQVSLTRPKPEETSTQHHSYFLMSLLPAFKLIFLKNP